MGNCLLTTVFRWPLFSLSDLGSSISFLFFDSSYLGLSAFSSIQWPAIDFSLVDDVAWAFVMVLESVALVSMLCCFFVFCGCSL